MATIQFYAIVEANNEGTPSGPTAPTITSANSASATVGVAFSFTPAATGTDPKTWSTTTLPAGLTLNTSTGNVSGTPSAAGSPTWTYTASNGTAPNATQVFTLTVSAASTGAVHSIVIDPDVTERALVGSTVQLIASGFSGGLWVSPLSVTWAVIEGSASVSSGGLVTVGASAGRITIKATSTLDPEASATAVISEVTRDMDDTSLQSLSYQGGILTGTILFNTTPGRVKIKATYGGKTDEMIFGPGLTVPIAWNVGIQEQQVKFLAVGLPAS